MTSNFRCAALADWLPWALLVAAAAGCSRAGGAPEKPAAAKPHQQRAQAVSTSEVADLSGDAALDAAGRIDRLRMLGRFEEFIDEALEAALAQPQDARLLLLKSEALLASGLPARCEDSAKRAAALAAQDDAPELLAGALKLWTAARFRQSKPLDETTVAQLLAGLPVDDESARMLDFWRELLGSRTPYRLEADAGEAVELEMAETERGSIPFELAAIQARANGQALPLVFLDTGAQYTLMTVKAARAAGVVFGEGETRLVGFRGLAATPGVVETLELGGLVLYDVPVLVGDSAPLVALEGQMSLGTELMHHVRFHIDYPARRVRAEPAGRATSVRMPPAIWEIPLWTFSQVCLARGQLAAGPMARVLVDTGNRSGTFVSYRWARRHLPQLRGTNTSLVFRLKKRNLSLEKLDLGSQTLATWPVTDTMPPELDRLNQVDVILGHDLLWPYQLTIDLPRRMLELRPGSEPAGAAADAPARETDGND